MEQAVWIIEPAQAGERLDRFLAEARPERSRTDIQRDIRAGEVSVSGEIARQPSRRLRANDRVAWSIHPRAPLVPRPVALSLLYEDDHLLVLDKPSGLVVHPGAGTVEPTLVEGLLCDRSLPESDDPARPGLVHRLDKDTSGLLVVAKTPAALTDLRAQFAARTVAKGYLAVVDGVVLEDEGMVDAPIGRDPARPRRMAVRGDGRAAQTEFRVLRRLEQSTLVLAHPRTGRTHQIRLHLRFAGHPIVGDPLYGTPSRPPATRLLLHAWRLSLRHPATGEPMRFQAPVPSGFPEYPFDILPWEGGGNEDPSPLAHSPVAGPP